MNSRHGFLARRAGIVAAALPAGAPALAQRLGQAAETDVPIWRVLGALAFCLALAVAAAILLKRRFGAPGRATFGRAAFGRARRLQLVESLRLSHQTDLCIVRCDDAELLVAATPHGAILLRPDLPPAASPGPAGMRKPTPHWLRLGAAALLMLVPAAALAAPHLAAPAAALAGGQTSGVIRIALILAVMAVIPALLICMTSFVRIVVVLSMIRHAFGMPETPPNQVLVSLALLLTAFSMAPTFSAINTSAVQPFLAGNATVQQALDQGSAPLRSFMLRQVHDQDLETVYAISRTPLPNSAADVGLMQLTTAFMLNELRVAFKIGFVVLLPFLLIDLVVSSILLALGMLMVPPTTLSLPIKVLMFVLIDGWSLVLEGVLGSFH